jgi:phosphoserine phosphatase
MAHVLCLIADAERDPLEAGVVNELMRALGGAVRWLADGEACELAIEGGPKASLAHARAATAGMAVDVCLLPAAHRQKQALVCDLDSTIITIETIDELADCAGVKAEVAAITRRAMRGELDFAMALRARVRLLEGLPETIFEQVYRERARLMPGARTLVRTMRARGATTALVSGGFLPVAERVHAEVGFDVVQANTLEVADGRLTGRVIPPIVGPDAKLAMLERLRLERGLAAEQTLAVGDGANDLPMLLAAGLGVAYHAHAPVARQAPVAIEHADLRALLFLQGIAKRDFVLT